MGLRIVVGDLTEFRGDAIVNAANRSLLGGGGVDGAIHRVGGPEILAACRTLRRTTLRDGLPTGQAVHTVAGRLPVRWVIHTVGPIYRGDPSDPLLLADAYRNSLALAHRVGARSVGVPSISTGSYGYPEWDAAPIALREATAVPDLDVTFVLYRESTAVTYRTAADGLGVDWKTG